MEQDAPIESNAREHIRVDVAARIEADDEPGGAIDVELFTIVLVVFVRVCALLYDGGRGN